MITAAGFMAVLTQSQQEAAATNWWLVVFTGALVLVGLLQLFVFGRQATRLKETVLEMRSTATRQLRAYITVLAGNSIFQDGTKNLRFELQPRIRNTGQTPAYDVVVASYLDVLPFPLPPDADLSKAVFGPSPPRSVIAAGQEMTTTTVMDRLLSDPEMAAIQAGSVRVYVYGTVKYRDAFGIDRRTNFCQAVIWLPGIPPFWTNTAQHNDAT